ncbi:MAG TPA: alpha/beta hydrolase [Chitinophagaceae bacterium]|nr:alpha/beta hydrolase [Chitinophagaceae bacterium]
MKNTSLDLNAIAFTHINNYPGRPTLVFLHDFLGCIRLWRGFPEKLAALTACNVLVYDRQGYGASCAFSYEKREKNYMELEADILKDLLHYWKIENPILFSHSDGASIALIFAGKYPKTPKALILKGLHVFIESITIKGIKEAIEKYKTTDLKFRLEKYHGDKTDALFWAWAETWTSEDFQDWNIEHFLKYIQCPILVFQGEKDEFGTIKQVKSVEKNTLNLTQSIFLIGI